MEPVQCRCGHVLPDVSDRLPYKAYFHTDEDDEAFWDGIVRETLGLLKAVKDGDKQRGIMNRMLPNQEQPATDAELLSEALGEHAARYLRNIYQCEACGRLLVETKARSGTYRYFVPEDDDRTVLASGDEPPPVS
jgi:hypothetical protein